MSETAEALAKDAKRQQNDLRRAVRDRDPKELAWGHVMRYVYRLMAGHPFLIGSALLLTLMLAAAEVFSFSLLLPFLGAIMGTGASQGLAEATPLAFLVPYFADLSTVETIRIVAGLMFANELVKSGLNFALTRNAQYLHILIARDLRLKIFDEIMRVELRFVNKQKTSNLFTILHSFPTSASRIVDQIMMGLQNATSFIAIVVTLLLINWKLTLLAGALALIVNGIIIYLGNIVRRRARTITRSRLELHRMTLETLNAIRIVHLFGRIGHARRRFLGRLQKHQENQNAKAQISSLLTPLHSVLNSALIMAVLIGATFIMVRDDAYWVALLGAFMAVVLRFMGRSGKYAKRRNKIAAELPAMEAIIDFLERDDKTYLKNGRTRFSRLEDGVRFDNVRFRYDLAEPEAIRGTTFDIPKGQMIALVGASGAGKSTLIDLLARLFDPTDGHITVDGTDLRRLDIESWRHKIAVVSQTSFLFSDNVRENIRYGRIDATDAEIEDAARRAQALDFIQELPYGFDTPCGDRGVRLSGGQAQRIAIARAILADPEILVLDEATSALDAETEHLVQRALEELRRDRTVIAIAHRLATVKRADNIIVLEDGQIIEQGTHAELLAKQGRYWQYVQMQSLDIEDMDEAAVQSAAADPTRVDWDRVFEEEDVLTADAPDPLDLGSRRTVDLVIRLAHDADAFVESLRAVPEVQRARTSGKRIHLTVSGGPQTIATILKDLLGAGAVPLAFGRLKRDQRPEQPSMVELATTARRPRTDA